MSEIDLKKKYLQLARSGTRAHHHIHGDSRNTKRRGKLQASVEPIGVGKERRAKHTAEKLYGGSEWNESCSDSDSLSHRSSSSQLALFDPRASPPLEMKSLVSPSSRLSPTFQSHHPRTPFTSVSMPPLQQSRKHPTSNSRHQKVTLDASELEAQLQIQTDVNRELKRLLVASVGSDLELRLQQIAREKAELSQDLDISLQKVMNNHEELDQVSIECDIWRSKFIASRVMIDELASWKAELSLQLRECRKALRYMMHERGDICRELAECSAHLQRALSELDKLTHTPHSQQIPSKATNVATVTPIQYCSQGAPSVMGENRSDATALELAQSNTIAARDLTSLLHRVTVGDDSGRRAVPGGIAPPPHVFQPTAGERLAQQAMNYRVQSQGIRETSPPLPKLLLTDADLVHHRPSAAANVSSSLPPLSRRLFHFGAKALEDPFRIPFHCTKCRGRIMIV
jgi:hypothetical protein